MSWRVVAVVLIFIMTMIAMQPLLGPALSETTTSINETGDYNESYMDGNSDIRGMYQTLLNGVLLAVFGVMGWGAVRVVRKERFRGLR